jgi:hypothetical protein
MYIQCWIVERRAAKCKTRDSDLVRRNREGSAQPRIMPASRTPLVSRSQEVPVLLVIFTARLQCAEECNIWDKVSTTSTTIAAMDSESIRSSRRPSAVHDDEAWQRRRSAMYRRSSNYSEYV